MLTYLNPLKGPGTYLLEPVATENCENSKLTHGSSNKVNAKTLLGKVFIEEIPPIGDVTR